MTGRKQELVAGVFAAVENGVEPVNCYGDRKEIRTEYDSKLKVDDIIIPDPYANKGGLMKKM